MLKKNFFGKFEEKLLLNGKNLEGFFKKSILIGFFLFIISAIVCFFFEIETVLLAIISVSLLFLGIFLNYFFEIYFFEQQKKEKEDMIGDLLLEASAFPKAVSIAKIMKFFSKADFGLLGKEFEKALLETEKGASVESALENIKKRCKSRIIDRAIDLLIRGYESGADLSTIFRESADDFFETNSLLRERNAALIVEKYTLLFAGGLIVPLVLGLLAGMVSGIDFSGLEILGIGNSDKSMLEITILANQIYIAEYAVLASIFVASQEGNSKKAVLYATILLPVSFAANIIAKNIVLF